MSVRKAALIVLLSSVLVSSAYAEVKCKLSVDGTVALATEKATSVGTILQAKAGGYILEVQVDESSLGTPTAPAVELNLSGPGSSPLYHAGGGLTPRGSNGGNVSWGIYLQSPQEISVRCVRYETLSGMEQRLFSGI